MVSEANVGMPDLLIVGPVTRDLLPGGGWRVGGTVLYGAVAAIKLGLRVGVLTCGPSDVEAALREAVPAAEVVVRPSTQATTFENVYDGSGTRRQYLRGRCELLRTEDIPLAWRGIGRVLLAPLARDVDHAIVDAFSAETRLAATPQGWLRQWDETGRVFSGNWDGAARALRRIEVLILSDEDLADSSDAQRGGALEAAEDDDLIGRDPQVVLWRELGALVVVTQGDRGATFYARSTHEHYPAFPARGEDPTGAGDVFATALLRAWWWGGDVPTAMRFANAAASFVVERAGTGGIPSEEEVRARLATSAADGP